MARSHGQVTDGKTWCEGCRVWYRTIAKFEAHRCSGTGHRWTVGRCPDHPPVARDVQGRPAVKDCYRCREARGIPVLDDRTFVGQATLLGLRVRVVWYLFLESLGFRPLPRGL